MIRQARARTHQFGAVGGVGALECSGAEVAIEMPGGGKEDNEAEGEGELHGILRATEDRGRTTELTVLFVHLPKPAADAP